MDRQVAAHAVAGAVAVIDPAVPQMHPRQRVERAAARAVGEFLHVELDVALQHASVALDHFGTRLARADPNRTGDVGGSVQILAARIDQIDRRWRDRDIAVFVDLVVWQGGMRPRSADGVEAGVFQHAAGLAEFAQLGGGGQFVHPALGRFDRNPAQETRNGRAVARLGIAVALLFGRVLDRLGQNGRIGIAHDLRAACRQGVEDARHRMVGIHRDGLAPERLESGLEFVAIAHGNGVAQMLGQFGRDLVGRDEQFRRAVCMGQHIGQRNRRVVDIGAAHVEQPGYRIQRTDDGRIIAFVLQPVGDFGALVRARPAGMLVGMRHGCRKRSFGTVVPDRIDRITVDRHQFDALLGKQLFRVFCPADAVQPGIVTDLCALRGMGGNPFGGRCGGHILVIVQLAVHLLAHLHGVSAIGEHGGRVFQHCGTARAAAEAGQPFQALCVRADIFAHMFIGNRDHEAIQAAAAQFLA